MRRVVTATDPDGRSYVLLDGPAGAVLHQPGRGLTFHELWVTDGPLARNEGVADAAAGPVVHHPPEGGSRFRIVELLPDQKQDASGIAADMAVIGAADRLVGHGEDGMHRNHSVDYNVVISGEVFAKVDLGEVLLRPGDTLIQRGTSHTWHNRSAAPCVFASVMVSAVPLPPTVTERGE